MTAELRVGSSRQRMSLKIWSLIALLGQSTKRDWAPREFPLDHTEGTVWIVANHSLLIPSGSSLYSRNRAIHAVTCSLHDVPNQELTKIAVQLVLSQDPCCSWSCLWERGLLLLEYMCMSSWLEPSPSRQQQPLDSSWHCSGWHHASPPCSLCWTITGPLGTAAGSTTPHSLLLFCGLLLCDCYSICFIKRGREEETRGYVHGHAQEF